jgi:hypothetical protein
MLILVLHPNPSSGPGVSSGVHLLPPVAGAVYPRLDGNGWVHGVHDSPIAGGDSDSAPSFADAIEAPIEQLVVGLPQPQGMRHQPMVYRALLGARRKAIPMTRAASNPAAAATTVIGPILRMV